LTAGLDSKFTVFDLRTQHKDNGFASVTTVSHKSTIWVGAHLPQNRDIFMTAGGNGSLHLWKYKYPGNRVKQLEDGSEEGVAGEAVELNRVSSSTQPIFSFEWSSDKEGLCLTTAADQTMRVMIVTRLNLQ